MTLRCLTVTTLLSFATFATFAGAEAQIVLFEDDFESGMSQWTGKSGGPHSGVIVWDPLRPSNLVVRFTQITSYGDIFSPELPVIDGRICVLTFDYLGLAQPGSVPDDFGGFAGWSENEVPTGGRWLAGTSSVSGAYVHLIDDGVWRTYSIPFDPFGDFTPQNSSIHVRFEDFNGSHGIPGDAYFDNVSLEKLAPVSVESSTWAGIKLLYR